MSTIDPKPGRIKELMKTADPDAPIVMINLLKFRQQANYPEGSSHSDCSGAQAYQRYSDVAFTKIREAGGSVSFMSTCLGTLIGPDEEVWDKAILVKYPSFKAFIAMIMAEEYQAASVHRTASMENARLIMSEEQQA
ncbi:MAG: DUF1330 domain-containing protein [Cellvibrionaceae bacterium]